MKTKKSNLIPMIIGVVVVLILAGLFFSWQMGWFKGKKQDIDGATTKLDTSIGAMSDFDVTLYDGGSISGDEIVELINNVVAKGPELSIAVQTLVNAKKATPITIYYNKALTNGNAINTSGTITTLDQSNKSNDNYLTPSAAFLGKSLRNSNNEITGILFIQQK